MTEEQQLLSDIADAEEEIREQDAEIQHAQMKKDDAVDDLNRLQTELEALRNQGQ